MKYFKISQSTYIHPLQHPNFDVLFNSNNNGMIMSDTISYFKKVLNNSNSNSNNNGMIMSDKSHSTKLLNG